MNITEWVETNVKIGRDRDVIKLRLTGETLESIGKKFGVTREYTRQIINRVLRYKPVLDEDLSELRYWFENYGFLKVNHFNAIFNVPEHTYHYWGMTCKRNFNTDFEDLLADPKLPKELYPVVVDQFKHTSQYKELHWHDLALEFYADVFKNNPYGKLTVIDVLRYPVTTGNRRYQVKFLCQCTCGNTTEVATNNLSRTNSCGCDIHKLHTWTRKAPVINLSTGKKYDSIKAASEDTNVPKYSIVYACRGRNKIAGGYMWAYLETNNPKVRCVETGEIFPNANQAGVGVWQVLHGRAKTANGYHWEYVE